MALHVPRAPGFSSMMKDGARFFSGLEEAVIRNIGKTFYYNDCELNCTTPQKMFFECRYDHLMF